MSGTSKNSEISDNARKRRNHDESHHDLEHLKTNDTTSTIVVGYSYDCKKKDSTGKHVVNKVILASQCMTYVLHKNGD